MALTEHLQKALIAALEEQNKKVREHDKIYQAASEYVGNFGEEKIKAVAQISPEIERIVKEAAKAKGRALLQQQLAVDELVFDVIVNTTGSATELLLPVRNSNRTLLERDVAKHFYDTLRAQLGKIDGYTALRTKLDPAVALKSLPEAMREARVQPVYQHIAVPLMGSYGMEEARIHLTPTAIKYTLIPVRKETKEFFPGYKQEFKLVMPNGTCKVWVTSRDESSDGQGGYIQGVGDGAFRNAFKALKLKETDTLVVQETSPKAIYKIAEVLRK